MDCIQIYLIYWRDNHSRSVKHKSPEPKDFTTSTASEISISLAIPVDNIIGFFFSAMYLLMANLLIQMTRLYKKDLKTLINQLQIHQMES